MLNQINELDTEIDEELVNLRTLLDKLPVFANQLKTTVTEMQLSSNPDDDFEEKKDEILEQLEELGEIEISLRKFDDSYK